MKNSQPYKYALPGRNTLRYIYEYHNFSFSCIASHRAIPLCLNVVKY